MGETNSGKIRLKLLVDRTANRVLLVEAEKEFVDFLFHILTLPVGTVVKLLSTNKMFGSLGKIYKSIDAMDTHYMEHYSSKEPLLNPKIFSNLGDTPFFLGNKTTTDEINATNKFYRCNRNCANILQAIPMERVVVVVGLLAR
ncbi:uncharacterized protein LOC141685064 [Apium graveolens]|uniref:uncharacterized protein LOC141685064 n=1 Tax=Apium graveolens TaxID=4045 RepID=UPI003D7B9898